MISKHDKMNFSAVGVLKTFKHWVHFYNKMTNKRYILS